MYNTANNSFGKLEAGISSSATTFIMQSAYSDLFPEHNGTTDVDYFLKLEKKDSNLVVIKREIVKVTERNNNIFTIERGSGFCPSSDTAETQTNTSFSFDSGDSVSLTITSEHIQQIETDIQSKSNDDEVVHNTGDETITGIKTFSSSPIVPAPTTDMQASTKKYVDDNLTNIIEDVSALYETGLIAGESITANDSVFLETQPKTSEVETLSHIGSGTSTTRVSETVFGSGISGNTIVAPISKNASPSAFLRVTVETDNAGNPTGTLIDANATVDIDPAGLVNTENVVNNHSFLEQYANNAPGWTQSCTFAINSSDDIVDIVVQKFASDTATQCRIKNAGGTVLSTVSFVGNYADFGSLKLTKSLVYTVECNIATLIFIANSTGQYVGPLATITPIGGVNQRIADVKGFTARRASDVKTITFPGSFTIPKGTVCHLVMKQVGDVTNASNYYYIGYKGSHTSSRSLRDYNGSTWGSATGSKFVGLESTLFAKKVLSKTDADYTYKLSTNGISMFAKESANAGDVVNTPCFGPLGGFTGLEDVTYYVGNTPGAISATPGTNSQKVGKGISDTRLFISGSMTP